MEKVYIVLRFVMQETSCGCYELVVQKPEKVFDSSEKAEEYIKSRLSYDPVDIYENDFVYDENDVDVAYMYVSHVVA